MRIIVKYEEIDGDVWDDFCEMFGLSPYCLNEGADPDTEQEMTKLQASMLGIL
ncbi:hypothetical protein LCGC14_2032260 [marine sediment metagenome]|uniref:Uncharacterized protein n=1 Tax=marine sediment metagenome TaxID=412755 RepID=A0A0F9EUI4_9ZZZZ